MSELTGLDAAVRAAGNRTKLARLLGIKAPSIYRWAGGVIPAHWVIAIEATTGVPRETLRPDLYPPRIAANTRPDAV